MQAIIMAAGKGSRLGKLTEGNPKSFVEIKGKKLIEYNLDILRKYHVDRIVIVTGYRNEAFEQLTKDMPNVKLVYNPFYEMVNVLGSFYMGMNELNDDFFYLHADTICDPKIFEKMLQTNADIALPVEFKVCDEEAMKICRQDGKIVQISKQIPCECAEGEFIGIGYFKKNTIIPLQKKVKQLMQEKEFTAYFESAIQRLIDEEKFDIETVAMDDCFWAEIDFIEDYNKAVENIPDSLLNCK